MLLLARQYANHTTEFDLDKEEKLAKATKYANDAMGVIPNAAKPNPQLSDAQWEGFKKDYMSQAHEGLGMIADVRKKYDVAATEYRPRWIARVLPIRQPWCVTLSPKSISESTTKPSRCSIK